MQGFIASILEQGILFKMNKEIFVQQWLIFLRDSTSKAAI